METIIGVDVGNGLTKTVHTEFTSAVKDYGETKPSIMDKTVMFEGHYYTVGGKRSKTKTDQKEEGDMTAFILTLAGIGEELKARNIKDTDVVLSEGLPLERCIEENIVFDEKYYRKGETLYFEYEDIPHTIFMKEVFVNPQCISAVIDTFSRGLLPPICLLIDIGSWTVDIVPMIDGKPRGSEAHSLIGVGIINCMLSCNEEVRRRTGREVMEEQIQQIMRGKKNVLPPRFETVITESIKKYIKDLCDTLYEHSYNIDTVTCIIMGGGATVVRNFGGECFPIAKYITDIRANAIGFEKLAKGRI